VLTEQGPLTIDGSSVLDVKSAAIGDTIRVTVVPPLFYDALQMPLATLYVLDGNLCLPIVSSIARTLQSLAFGLVPPMICVGIGYPTDDVLDVMALRTRDLTPVTGELPPSPMPMDKYGTGGADALLTTLVDDVFPIVQHRWRSDPGDRCLIGWSFGGLFALHALFTRPDAFARYIATSPSIWWSERAILREEESYASSHDDLAAKIFACVGEREETAPARMWPPLEGEMAQFAMSARMVSDLDDLVARLRSRRYPGLDLTHTVFADEHHTTVFPAAVTRGLTKLYSTV
jgi:predicted alpha/beta superfamily hydrolase